MKVHPTNSGTIVQRRAQVLIGSRMPWLTCRLTFAISLSSTYGPFLTDLPMSASLFYRLP
jgi:hypothetical protein